MENLRAEFATVSAERDGLRKDRAELRHKLSGFAQRIKDNDKQCVPTQVIIVSSAYNVIFPD